MPARHRSRMRLVAPAAAVRHRSGAGDLLEVLVVERADRVGREDQRLLGIDLELLDLLHGGPSICDGEVIASASVMKLASLFLVVPMLGASPTYAQVSAGVT